ncbi:MAG: helix-turn-helix transcriptional regulator, partial [Rhodoferax sp.]|nr:helix-turn-helix transcriptional regulator [Rhodoferax sp.]
MTDFSQVPNIGALHEPLHEPLSGAGALLRQAREAAGLQVIDLAVSMKVKVKKLEALEAERFAELGDSVYVRALAASMCRALKIDATPILGKLPKTLTPRLNVQERGLNRPFQTHSGISVKAAARFVTRPSVLLVLLLLAGVVVLLFFPDINSSPVEAETAKAKYIPISTDPTATTPTTPATPPANVAQVPKPASSALASGRAPVPVLAPAAAKPAQAASAVAPTPAANVAQVPKPASSALAS